MKTFLESPFVHVMVSDLILKFLVFCSMERNATDERTQQIVGTLLREHLQTQIRVLCDTFWNTEPIIWWSADNHFFEVMTRRMHDIKTMARDLMNTILIAPTENLGELKEVLRHASRAYRRQVYIQLCMMEELCLQSGRQCSTCSERADCYIWN